MDETAKRSADEENIVNDEEGGELQKDATSPSPYEHHHGVISPGAPPNPGNPDDVSKRFDELILVEELVDKVILITPEYSESIEDFNAAWEAMLRDNPSSIAPVINLKDECLDCWGKRNRARFDEKESYSKCSFPQPSLADGYSYRHSDSSLAGGRLSKSNTAAGTSLPKRPSRSKKDNFISQLSLITPEDSKSVDDFNAAWEAMLRDNPSLIAPFIDRKDECLDCWRERNRAPPDEIEYADHLLDQLVGHVQYCDMFSEVGLADGYNYRHSDSWLAGGRLSKSNPAAGTSLPSKKYNFISQFFRKYFTTKKATGTKMSEVAEPSQKIEESSGGGGDQRDDRVLSIE